jgi:serine/threonine-protein kinase
MNDFSWQRVEAVLDQALDLPEVQRKKFINEQCKGQPKLKGEITRMLESISRSEGWLETPEEYKRDMYDEMADDVQLLSSDKYLVGTEVGSYLIKEKIAEGGMGVVFLAEHSSADIEHKVAIKIIRSGKATQENIKRFEREQRILAGLNHSGIARLFNAGATEDGAPYIIMEYVDGIPIDEYCIEQNCSLDYKIDLFKDILQAVRYAHENLVIHRDLKPGNILVDAEGNIKILDFGISKLLEDEKDNSLTKTGTRLLTPRYAAPEQVLQKNITTATDLYALGIIFYQLLSGEHPFDFAELSQYEIEQTILNQEAANPSTKVLELKLQKKLQGDLDAIALKAIRKESDQRYRVANEFLEDLKNYNQGIPVSAVEDSFRYRSQKFFKRHKRAVAIAAGMLLLVVGLTGFYTWRIAQERNVAQIEAERAKQIKEFTFQIFGSINPDFSGRLPKDITATELLKSGTKTIHQELQNQPAIYVELMTSVGNSLQSFDEHESAISALEKALQKSREIPNNSLQTANVLMSLANINNTIENPAKAKELVQESINTVQIETPAAFQQLAYSHSKLGFSFALEGDYTAAKKNYIKADSLYFKSGSQKSLSRYDNLRSLAEIQIRLEDYENAEKNILNTLNFYKSYYDTLNPDIARTQSMLGNFYSRIGQYDKANKYLNDALENNYKLWDEENSNTASIYGMLALNYLEIRDLNKAIDAIQKNVALVKKIRGKESYRYSISLNNLALIQSTRKEFKQAKINYNEALNIKKRLLPSNHPSLAIAYYNFGSFLDQQKEHREAITYFEKAIAIDKEALGIESVGVAIDNNRLASSLVAIKEYSRADSLFANAQSILQRELPKNHKRIAENLVGQGKLFIALNQFESAKQNFEQAIAAYRSNFDETDTRIIEADSLLTLSIQKLE